MLTIPIYDTILLPDVTFYFRKEVIEGWEVSELSSGDEIAFAMLREDTDIETTTLADVYPIGVIAKIESIDSEGNVKVRTKDRVSFLEFSRDYDNNIDALLEVRPEIDDLEPGEEQERFETLKNKFLKFVQNYQWGLWARGFILQWKNINELACSMTGYFSDFIITQMHADTAFISTDAVDGHKGLMAFSLDNVMGTRNMINGARQVILLCDHTKFSRIAFVTISELDEIDRLITGKEVDPAALKPFYELGIEVDLV